MKNWFYFLRSAEITLIKTVTKIFCISTKKIPVAFGIIGLIRGLIWSRSNDLKKIYTSFL